MKVKKAIRNIKKQKPIPTNDLVISVSKEFYEKYKSGYERTIANI